jgi:hypothetical protein
MSFPRGPHSLSLLVYITREEMIQANATNVVLRRKLVMTAFDIESELY